MQKLRCLVILLLQDYDNLRLQNITPYPNFITLLNGGNLTLPIGEKYIIYSIDQISHTYKFYL